MRESRVETHFVRRAKRAGGSVRKVKWLGYNGAPDRLLLLPAKPCRGVPPCDNPKCNINLREAMHPLVELKRPKGGKLEDHQVREHERLRAAGFTVVVLFTIKEVDAYFDALA